jgi:hypothetical protein
MREIDGLPVYKITIDKEYSENGEDLGVDMIAFTSNPAIQVKGMAFESHEPKKLFFKDEVKMRIAAPSMIPMDIYRKDEDEEYYVEFTAEVIEEIHAKMMANLKTKDLFNLEHEAEKKVPAYVHEILLVDSEAKQKYIKDEYDIDTKLGSQFVVSQITDKDYYNSLVENEQFAYSIEGFLGLKLNKQNRMDNPKFELDGKFYELVDGVPVEVKASEEVVAEEEVAPVAEVAEEVALEDDKEKEEETAMEDSKEEEEEMKEHEEEEKEKMAVDPEADAEAIMAIVAPALDALRAEILEALAEKQVEEEEVVEEEVEMEATQLSITERFGAIARAFKDVNY